MRQRNYSQTFFLKIKIDHISGSTVGNVAQFACIVCLSGGLPKYIKTKLQTTCIYVIESFFKKQKEVLD